jgi:hypothetical protein
MASVEPPGKTPGAHHADKLIGALTIKYPFESSGNPLLVMEVGTNCCPIEIIMFPELSTFRPFDRTNPDVHTGSVGPAAIAMLDRNSRAISIRNLRIECILV